MLTDHLKKLVCLFIVGITACTPNKTISSNVTAVPSGDGPFQIITYENERVEREYMVMENGKLYSEARAVYINRDGQFVHRDGSPIVNWRGEKLFFNDQGLIVTASLIHVPESSVFSVNNKPLKNGTSLMFKTTYDEGLADVKGMIKRASR